MRSRLKLLVCVPLALTLANAGTALAAPLYPDIKTLPPRELRLARADVSADGSGQFHNVLRFSNTVWNAGQGQLMLRGTLDPATKRGPAMQRIFDSDGTFTDRSAGTDFYYHAVHNHYHYNGWGRYQLWTKAEYDAWVASGRTQGSADEFGVKTTSCVLDEETVRDLPGTPANRVFPVSGCQPNGANQLIEGISPGWGDTYDWNRYEQWVDLDQRTLADGDYVLRSVSDPDNQVYESPNKADAARESQQDNEAITAFSIRDGGLVDSNDPSGTVLINGVDTETSSSSVTISALGRDDISGVDQVRVSNDGVTWATLGYTGTNAVAMEFAWDLADSRYGGTGTPGTKTVHMQFHDRSGRMSATVTDTINLAGGSSSTYSSAVLADSPISYWRLGETSGTVMLDSRSANGGSYAGSPGLGASSLLSSDANRSVRFDGVDDRGAVADSGSLDLGTTMSLEAWIKPQALPSSGSFASVVAKAESYALQFNGPLLEFTLIQGGTRQRLQAPAGTVRAGQTYHVVGTHDGARQRLYVNGVEVASRAQSGAPTANAAPLLIGSWNGSGENFDGTIDDAAVYGATLSAARVGAHYTAGSGAPPSGVPNRPTGVTAASVSDTAIDLAWQDNSANEQSFVLERSTSATFTTPTQVTLAANTTTYRDTALSPATTYYYRVRATNASGPSANSDPVTVTTRNPSSAGYAATVLDDGPQSYWRLGESSGTVAGDQQRRNEGQYQGSPALGSSGLLSSDSVDTGVAFDGSDDRVRVPSAPTLDLTSSMTLEAWIRPRSLPSAGSFASVAAKAESYALQFNGPQLELTIIQGGSRRRLQAPAGAIRTGTTYHVVGTYDGTTQRLYINGAEVANRAQTGGANVNASSFLIGSWNGTGENFDGTIDEVAVYNNPLSAALVGQHYSAGSGSSPPVGTPARPTGLTATAASASAIDLRWTDNSSNEQSFVVERATSSAFTTPTPVTLAANATTYRDTGLTANTTYYYRVRATNSAGASANSDPASATTATGPPPSGYAATVLGDSPVSYWRLGEASGTVMGDARAANNGTYAGGPGLGAPSLVGGESDPAVRFDGSNDRGTAPDSNSLDLASQITLEGWIRPQALPAAGKFASVISKTEAYALQFNGPLLEFTVIQGGSRRRLQAPAETIKTGTTYHVVATYDGSRQRLYVNGAEVGNRAQTGAANVNANPLVLGSWNGSSEFFNGTVDDVAVYKAALSAARVSAHAQAGGASAPAANRARPAGPAAPSGLEASARSESEIDLKWLDNSDDEQGFVLERATDAAFSEPSEITLPLDTTTYTDDELDSSTTYHYRLRAVGADGGSEPSDPASATTQGGEGTGYAQAVLDDEPHSYWRLGETDGDAADDEAGDHDGEYRGGPRLRAPSLIGSDDGAVEFDGSDDTVRVPSADALDPGSELTLEAWIRPGSLPERAQQQAPAEQGDKTRKKGGKKKKGKGHKKHKHKREDDETASQTQPPAPVEPERSTVMARADSYALALRGRQPELSIFVDGRRESLVAPDELSADRTYHVAATYDGDQMRLYVDGKEVAARSLDASPDDGGDFHIGSSNGDEDFFDGVIDEVAVYEEALDDARIEQHHDEGG